MEPHRYLLDTNVISAMVRDPRGAVFRALEQRLPATACTSIVVAAEIQFGLCKGVSDKLRAQVRSVLSALDVLPLEPPADLHYGEIRWYLQRTGQPIGQNDLLIAAHARALDLILVTGNARELERVPGLKVEDWLRESAARAQ